MADTWPVNNGAVGTQSSTENLSSRLDTKGETPTQADQEATVGLDAFGGEGATVIPGVGIDETPGANSATATKSGTAPAPSADVIPKRTAIIDSTENDVPITLDTFLQGLPGSLSQILGGAASSLLGKLGGTMNNLLNSTGLTSVLGDVVGQVSSDIGTAIKGFAGELTNAASELFTGLGNTISEIPGLGPVVDNFSTAVGSLTQTLDNAYNSLDPVLKAGVDGAVASVGARLLDKVGLPSIEPKTAGLIAGSISFVTNPANDFKNVARTSRDMDSKIFPTTGNNTFGNIAAKAEIAAQEFEKVLTVDSLNNFVLNNIPAKLDDQVRAVVDGSIADLIPENARLFTGVVFSNERIKSINGKTYVVPR